MVHAVGIATAGLSAPMSARNTLLIDTRSTLGTFTATVAVLRTGWSHSSGHTLVATILDDAAGTETVLDVVTEGKGSGITNGTNVIDIVIRSTVHTPGHLTIGRRGAAFARPIFSTLPRRRTLQGLGRRGRSGGRRRHGTLPYVTTTWSRSIRGTGHIHSLGRIVHAAHLRRRSGSGGRRRSRSALGVHALGGGVPARTCRTRNRQRIIATTAGGSRIDTAVADDVWSNAIGIPEARAGARPARTVLFYTLFVLALGVLRRGSRGRGGSGCRRGSRGRRWGDARAILQYARV